MADNKHNKGPMQVTEKAKDLKKSMKRLLKELTGYKVFIIISIILASISAILSIFSPNKLSDLTD